MGNKKIDDPLVPIATEITGEELIPYALSGAFGALKPKLFHIGLIKIIDLDGFFFTDLVSAKAYIRTMIDDTTPIITQESFRNGVFYFTVPAGTPVIGEFLVDTYMYSINKCSFEDPLGLITGFNASCFSFNSGNHVFLNPTFRRDCFQEFHGTVILDYISGYFAAAGPAFALNSSGKFIFRKSLDGTTGFFGSEFFKTSTATIEVPAFEYTSNAGGIHGDLVHAIANGANVQFNGINLAEKIKVTTITSSATPTPNVDNADLYKVTALAAAATFGSPTGTPKSGQSLLIRIKDNGTARALSFNSIYRFSTDQTAPTTTIINKTIYLGFIYNSDDSKWDCLGWITNL
jgi:hypothetical protein